MSNDDNKDFDYTLNPCKACKIKCPDPTDVNCINNCCYETLGAFDGAWSLNQVRNTERHMLDKVDKIKVDILDFFPDIENNNLLK